eukprot:TRINITY_DN80_c0_g1_i1.p1 TRINITY_DN80_c0_g1~~TRINITY_DN80_c0_g1_i1.p1  ORF type:complete len:422 (+),score=153.83 TRINITY_DN80_c0_g1_i1:57-1268(+)
MSCSTTFKIKCKDSNEIRRATLAEASWTNFVALLTKSTNSQEQEAALSKVSISYLDEEADSVRVSCEAEFAEALVVQAAKTVKTFSVEARDQKSCHRQSFAKACPHPFSFGVHPLFGAANPLAGHHSTSTSSDPNNNNNNNNTNNTNTNNVDTEGLTKIAQEFFKNVNSYTSKKDDSPADKGAEGSSNCNNTNNTNNTNTNNTNNIDMEGLIKVAQEFFKNVNSHTSKKDDSPADKETGQKGAEGSSNNNSSSNRNQQKEFDLGGALDELVKVANSVQSALPHVAVALSSALEGSVAQSRSVDDKLNFEAAAEPLNDLVKLFFCGPKHSGTSSSASQGPQSCQPKQQEPVGADQESQAVELQQFAEQLAMLKELGFDDEQTNLSLLTSAKGDLQTVINSLVDL